MKGIPPGTGTRVLTAMKQNHKRSIFKKKIRVSEKSHAFINEIRGEYSLAGKLDQIINEYKNAVRQSKAME